MEPNFVFTAPTYAELWILTHLEPSPFSVKSKLSGKDAIYDKYLTDCEERGQTLLSRTMLSKKIEIVMTLQYRASIHKKRGPEGSNECSVLHPLNGRIGALYRRQGTRPAVSNMTDATVQSNVTKERKVITLLK